jgi:hypothetical protein
VVTAPAGDPPTIAADPSNSVHIHWAIQYLNGATPASPGPRGLALPGVLVVDPTASSPRSAVIDSECAALAKYLTDLGMSPFALRDESRVTAGFSMLNNQGKIETHTPAGAGSPQTP